MNDRDHLRLQRHLGHTFADSALLTQALTHRSVGSRHNERLEFLGDSVLGFVVSSLLFNQYPGAPEAELTLMRAQLVKRETLARIASRINLGDALRFSAAAAGSGVHRRSSVLADGLEAVVGAVYLDGGISAAENAVRLLLEPELDTLDAQSLKDAKTMLQEVLQAEARPLPVYEVVATHGFEHARTYEVQCSIQGGVTALGTGRSRRAAEQDSATRVLALLRAHQKQAAAPEASVEPRHD